MNSYLMARWRRYFPAVEYKQSSQARMRTETPGSTARTDLQSTSAVGLMRYIIQTFDARNLCLDPPQPPTRFELV
ncbi:hypothetical protein AOLI_G00080090 [Acnodon oligacanthus]